MKRVGAALAIGAVFFNFSAEWALPGYGPYATWYIQQSIWVVVLCVVVRLLIESYPRSAVWALASTACVVGASEGLQNATCRLLVENGSSIPRGTTVCDYVTGLPIQATSITLYLLLFLWSVYKCRPTRRIL